MVHLNILETLLAKKSGTHNFRRIYILDIKSFETGFLSLVSRAIEGRVLYHIIITPLEASAGVDLFWALEVAGAEVHIFVEPVLALELCIVL